MELVKESKQVTKWENKPMHASMNKSITFISWNIPKNNCRFNNVFDKKKRRGNSRMCSLANQVQPNYTV